MYRLCSNAKMRFSRPLLFFFSSGRRCPDVTALLLAANYYRASMLIKIKMLIMCTMVRCVVLVYMCSSDSSPANLSVIPTCQNVGCDDFK